MTLDDHQPRRARRSLEALARPLRLRVSLDREGWPRVPGRLGQIEYHDGVDLAVYTERRRVFGKLEAIPGMRRHQIGDVERRWLFPPEALEQVAGVIRVKRRRRGRPLDSAAARAMALRKPVAATSGRQERVRAVGEAGDTCGPTPPSNCAPERA
jgi:hypothetical protein